MNALPYDTALVVGVGSGISASIVRSLAGAGIKMAAAARNIDKLKLLSDETGALLVQADAADPKSVEALFAESKEHRYSLPRTSAKIKREER